MNKCLIVVDYQNDFVDGALGFDGARDIEARIVEKIKHTRQEGGEVLFTLDSHDDSYMDTEEGKNLPIPHCVEGTEGHELTDAVNEVKESSDATFQKHTFPSIELGKYLQGKAFTEIELCGLVSHICVISNAIIAKAAAPEARIIVDVSATASYNFELHEKALDVMEGLHIHLKNRG